MEIRTSQYGTPSAEASRPRRSAYWPAEVPAATHYEGPTPHFRFAIWLTIALVSGLVLWLVHPAPEPEEFSPLFAEAHPSEWTEQARVTSPDGRLDAVVVVADDGEHRLAESGITEPRLFLSVRVVSAGERVARECAHVGFPGLFATSVAEKSVFVSGPAPKLTAQWKNNDVLVVNHAPKDAMARVEKTDVTADGTTKAIKVRYQP